MESRFAAYAVGAVDYIVTTTDPEGDAYESDEVAWRQSIEQFSEHTDFLGVDVFEAETEGERATVTFHAELRRDGEDVSFTEASSFRRVDGDWRYSSGKQLASDPEL